MFCKGQISIEALIGISIFLVFFLGIGAYTFSQNNLIAGQIISFEEEKECLELAQILTEVKLKGITWQGETDNNFYIVDDTVLVDYPGSGAFDGTYCNTINTETEISLLKGTWRISYTNVFSFEAV